MVDELIRGMDIFAGMQPYERTRMVEVLKPYTAEAGTRIIRQGDAGDAMYILAAGEACASISIPGRPDKEVKQYQVGGWFGEIALISNDKRAANVDAKTDVTCLRIEAADFERVLGEQCKKRMLQTMQEQLALKKEILDLEATQSVPTASPTSLKVSSPISSPAPEPEPFTPPIPASPAPLDMGLPALPATTAVPALPPPATLPVPAPLLQAPTQKSAADKEKEKQYIQTVRIIVLMPSILSTLIFRAHFNRLEENC